MDTKEVTGQSAGIQTDCLTERAESTKPSSRTYHHDSKSPKLFRNARLTILISMNVNYEPSYCDF